MRTLFIGGTKRGYLTLKALIENGVEVVGILSLQQDEHEIERYEEAIRTLAEKFRISHYQTKWMKDRDYHQIILREMQPQIAFVVGCRILLPAEIYQIPPLGTLAVHDSLLPEYRGFAPINWSILNGEDHLGVTLIYVNELMDGGDIVAQKRIPISGHDKAPEVYERVCQATTDLILEACPLLSQGIAPRIQQNYSAGSFVCSRIPLDGIIDWNKPTITIYNQIRALTYPYPGAFTFYKGKKLTIWWAEPLANPPDYVGRIPGRVAGVSKAFGHMDVLTGDGLLRVFEVQTDEGERATAASVIRSVRDTLGLQVAELLIRIQTLEAELARLPGGKDHQPGAFPDEALIPDSTITDRKKKTDKS